MTAQLSNPDFPFELESERRAKETFNPGSVCPDEGRCHHRCSAQTGCFRMDGCSPFSDSGLDDKWRALPNMGELARAEALSLEADIPSAASTRRNSI